MARRSTTIGAWLLLIGVTSAMGLATATVLLAEPSRSTEGPPRPRKISADGFILVLQNFNWNLTQDLSDNQVNCNLTISGEVDVPTETRAVGISSEVELFEAIDEQNKDLLKDLRNAVVESPEPRSFDAIEREPDGTPGKSLFSFSLSSDSRPREIRRLRGVVHLLIPKTQIARNLDLRTADQFHEIHPGVEVRLEQTHRSDHGEWKLYYRIRNRDARWGNGFGSPFVKPPEFTDQNGQPVDAVVISRENESIPRGGFALSGWFEMELRAKPKQEVAKVTAKVVTQVQEKSVPFEASDVMLTPNAVMPPTN